MLVLSRKPKQTIVIRGDITVAVLDIQRNRIKLGFNAPGDVPIFREEIVGTEVKPHTPRENEGMLVLMRKVGGKGVFINKDIFVKILQIDGGQVKVGIDAPSDIPIERGELITEGRQHGSKERF